MIRLRAEAEQVLAQDTGQPLSTLRGTPTGTDLHAEAAVEYGLVDRLVASRTPPD